ncbi:MAG: hypothetical protein IPG06_25070 [Haliea sp.]|nr:hypothetical protein [Haliea sp.]
MLFLPITHVFDEQALPFFCGILPHVQSKYLTDEALFLALSSFPDSTHVLDEDAPVFWLHSAPLQNPVRLGRLILFDILFPRCWLISLTPPAPAQPSPQRFAERTKPCAWCIVWWETPSILTSLMSDRRPKPVSGVVAVVLWQQVFRVSVRCPAGADIV